MKKTDPNTGPGQKRWSNLRYLPVVAPQLLDANEAGDVLVRKSEIAKDKFKKAHQDMERWQKTYYQAIKDFHSNMKPEYICPDISIPLKNLTIIWKQIEKVCFSKSCHFSGLHTV